METIEQYRAQPGGRKISAQTLNTLIEFRSKQGFRDAFLVNEMVNQASLIARGRIGFWGRTKGPARAEARLELRLTPPSAATYNLEEARLIGPRGGLPKSKNDLTRLSRAYGVNPEGETVDQVRHLICHLVETGARLYGESPVVSSALGGDGRSGLASGPGTCPGGGAARER